VKIDSPKTNLLSVRAVIAGLYGVLVGLAWPFVERDARRALRFLDAHL
jgi:hypothetical protein